ncbi:MAG: substrate-binding domain-containing protein, partial [Thermoguttaceae bacterium]
GTKDERDLNQQMRLVEQMIAERVDAIVIAPADSKALVTVCKRAIEKGIVVVNIDNRFDADVLAQSNLSIPFVGPDNREGARVVGEYLAGHLEPGDPVAILEGIPTAFNAQQRLAGFKQAMQDAGMKVVDVQSGQWEMTVANTVAAAMIIANPDLKAILCSNDGMALGAVAAVKAAGKTGEIAIVGFDNISAIRQMLEEGRVLATADQHGDQLAAYGIDFALQILAKGEMPKDKQTPVDLITAEKTNGEQAP